MRWIIVVCWFAANVAYAQPMTSSPGPLTHSHAHLDTSTHCNDCHIDGTVRVSSVQCRVCHEPLFAKGLHTRQFVVGKPCITCHGDHKGKSFDAQGWKTLPGGMQGFDHDFAGWKLQNAHVLRCDRCHTAKTPGGLTRFVGLSQECASCHQKRSPHGSLRECERCHTDIAWKPPKTAMDFDHDRDTKAPLVGSHKNVACAKCHPKGGFTATKTECSACHPTTKHKSPLFDATTCERCHTPQQQTFKTSVFDHDKTKFPLDSGHRVDCVKCHTAALGVARPSTTCETCHLAKSKHGKRFDKITGGCASCHMGAKWTTMKFDHRKTKLELTHKHAMIKCRACHRGSSPSQFEDFKGVTGCKECHEHAVVHSDPANPNGKYTTKQCQDCHRGEILHPPDGGRIALIYHGPKSTFPLVKMHKAVPCLDCHTQKNAKGQVVFEPISPECGDACHDDATHQGALGKKCTQCHTSGTWDALFFEHNRYRLDGEHVAVKCDGCHGADRKFRGTPRTCGDARCHADDDVHGGHLGKSCNRCHLTSGENRFNHQISSKFKLDGMHTGVTCDGCHPTREFKPRPMNCYGCHPEPPVHYGEYGTSCERCHTTKGWR